MSDSPRSLAAGSNLQPSPSYELRPLFKTRPSGTVVEAFEEHVHTTGSPEVFDRISTTRPPLVGRLAVICEFRAEKGKRPRGDLAPCPICSPDSPQYLHGLLIWCEETAAIYAIGMDCGAKLWRDGRLDQALTAFERAQARRALEDNLLARLPSVPEMRRWIAVHMPIAIAADRLSRGFRRRAPRVYSVAKQAFARGGDLPIKQPTDGTAPPDPIRLVGSGFTRRNFGAEDQLRRADRELGFLDFGADELDCIEAIGGMTSVEQVKALKWLRALPSQAERVFEFLGDCAAFLSKENMAALAKWSELPGAPFRLMAYADGRRVKVYLYQDQSDWGDVLDGMAVPQPPPGL